MGNIRRKRLTEVLRRLEVEAATPGRYCFGESGEYEIKVAASARDRRRAWQLAYRVYLEKEYADPDPERLWYGLHDALPETTTFLAESGGKPVAALTLVFDSPLKLPADEIYAADIDPLRRSGRRVCELVSLVSAVPGLRAGVTVTRHLFKLAYMVARKIENADDFVITVNPRHTRFYERTLMFEKLGPERDYGKVGGAPAVLLRLDLRTAEARYREKYGDKRDSFYRFFINTVTETRLLRMLRKSRAVLSEEALRGFFVKGRRLIAKAPLEIRGYLEDCYPFYDLSPAKSDTREFLAV